MFAVYLIFILINYSLSMVKDHFYFKICVLTDLLAIYVHFHFQALSLPMKNHCEYKQLLNISRNES